MVGITVLRVRALLPEHLFLGILAIPPVAVKMASTGYRFVRYYTGDREFRLAGPPPLALRLLAPLVVLSTLAVFATGLELWLFGLRFGSIWVAAHKLSFLVWLPVTAIHVLAHLDRSALAARSALSGEATTNDRGIVVAAVIAGIALALASLTYATPFIFFAER